MIWKVSPRGEEIILFVARGFTNKEIACELKIAEKTVETHLRNLYRKTGTRCRSEAVALYLIALSGKSIKGIPGIEVPPCFL